MVSEIGASHGTSAPQTDLNQATLNFIISKVVGHPKMRDQDPKI